MDARPKDLSATEPIEASKPNTADRWIILGGLVLVVGWTYHITLRDLVREWWKDDNYSVGQLVPLAALYLLWHDRQRLARCTLNPSWWGIVLILLAQLVRGAGLVWIYESIERYSFVLTIAGLVLLIGGWNIFDRTKWILLFLFLMVPLPLTIHNKISSPLQNLATDGAVATLELLGITVTQEGHIMILNDNVPVDVAEACSGLRMLTAFVVVAAVFAYVVHRPRWQKVVLLLSSVPVAIFCNLVRLVTTVLLFLWTTSKVADRFFHDFAGLTMMPLAILILMGELWLMSRLVIEEQDGPVKVDM